ncbi:hypothetical protein DTO169E5_7766 [Paecilomyces variotii]|nr:hypothetical protein DTO169E5_7766 [Paecilomyces variotii]KAJ9353506.1 hypothetical protein DTO027B9_5208 [Paecilomyces variotii]
MRKRKKVSGHFSPLFYPVNYSFRVTFGLLVRYRPGDYTPRKCNPGQSPLLDGIEPTYASVREKVIQVFSSSFLRVNKYDARDPDARRWTVKANMIATPLPHNRLDEHVNVLGFCPMDIVSPVIRLQEKPGMNSFAEIEYMLRILRKNFKVIVNSTCGLHVEIGCFTRLQHGRCIDKGFPLQTLRNFAQLVTLFEVELNALHPVDRALYADYCQLPSQLIKKSQDPVTLLDRCNDHTTLHQTWQQGIAMSDPLFNEAPPAYSFSNMLGNPGTGRKHCSPGMIEFRQHAGTIDPEKVYHWVKVAAQLVRFAHECGLGGLPASLLRNLDEERHCPSGQFDAISFLRTIGAIEQAEYYRDQLRQYPRPLPRHFDYQEQTDIRARADTDIACPRCSSQYAEEKVPKKGMEARELKSFKDASLARDHGRIKGGS